MLETPFIKAQDLKRSPVLRPAPVSARRPAVPSQEAQGQGCRQRDQVGRAILYELFWVTHNHFIVICDLLRQNKIILPTDAGKILQKPTT